MGKISSKGLQVYIWYRWRYPIASVILVLLVIASFAVGITDTPSGLNEQELEHLGIVDSYRNILSQPINPVTRIVQTTGLKLFGLSELGLRIGTLLVAGTSSILFFFVLKSLYWTRLALVGTFLLVTSSWFLHNARIGTDGISILFIFSLITLTAYQAYKTKHGVWLVLAVLSLALGLYTPLVFYMLLAAAIALYPEWLPMLKKMPIRRIIVAAIVGLIATLPLIVASIQDPQILRFLLNIPDTLPTIREYIINVGDSFSYVFWRSYLSPAYHLDQLPMLDVFTVAMVALGLFQFERSWPAPRTRVLFATSLVALLVASLNITDRTMLVFLPFVYLLAAIGMSTLLSQWQEIFPRNPIARTLGVIPIGIVLMLTLSYHYNRYFVAWQQAAETKAAFDQRGTLLYDRLQDVRTDVSKIAIVTSQNDLVRFQYLQTRYPDSVQVLADEVYIQQSDINDYSTVYIVSGARGIDVARTRHGDATRVQASEIRDDSWLFQEFTR